MPLIECLFTTPTENEEEKNCIVLVHRDPACRKRKANEYF